MKPNFQLLAIQKHSSQRKKTRRMKIQYLDMSLKVILVTVHFIVIQVFRSCMVGHGFRRRFLLKFSRFTILQVFMMFGFGVISKVLHVYNRVEDKYG